MALNVPRGGRNWPPSGSRPAFMARSLLKRMRFPMLCSMSSLASLFPTKPGSGGAYVKIYEYTPILARVSSSIIQQYPPRE